MKANYVNVSSGRLTGPDGQDWLPLKTLSLTDAEASSYLAYGTARKVPGKPAAAPTPAPAEPTKEAAK